MIFKSFRYSVLLVAAVTTFFLTLAPSHAADLLQCYRSALGYDAQYQAAVASLRAGREAYPQGLAGLLPTVTAQVSSQETRLYRQLQIDDIPADERTYQTDSYSVTLTQPIIRWSAWQNYRIGELQVAQAEAQFVQAQSDLIVRLAQAYFDVLLATESLRLTQSQKAAAAEKMALSRRSYEAGLATIVDFREAKARYDVVSAAEIATANEAAIKRLVLRQITGCQQHAPFSLASLRHGFVLSQLEPENQEFWMDQAANANPVVKANEAAFAIAGRTIEVNRAGHLPTLDLSMSHNDQRESGSITSATAAANRYSQIGLTLSIPIFAGGGISSKVRQAAHLYEEARAKLDRARREAFANAAEAYLNYVDGLARTKALDEAVQSGSAAVAASKRGVEVGLRLNMDVLDAEQQLFQSRRDLAKAKFDAIIAGLKLRAAAGSLNGDDVEKLNALLALDQR
jgi:outer membrane protein